MHGISEYKAKGDAFLPLKYLKPNWIALQVAKNYSSVGSALVEACMEVSPVQKRVSKELLCVVWAGLYPLKFPVLKL